MNERLLDAGRIKTVVDEDASDEELIDIPLDVEEFGAGYRLDRYLSLRFRRLSRARIHRMIDAQRVTCRKTGRVLRKKSARVVPGMQLLVRRPAPDEEEVSARFKILHEDSALLVIDKPGGLPVHPSARYHKYTLTSQILEHFGSGHPWEMAHRLDRETSGLMLFGIHRQSASQLKDDFFRRRISKTYLAIVCGHLHAHHDVDLPIGAAENSKVRIKMGPRSLAKGGLSAFTRVTSLSQGHWKDRPVTLVRAEPKTGRTHQIRVHLDALGFPLLGDKLYGLSEQKFIDVADGHKSATDLETELGFSRHALHAAELYFPHPLTGETWLARSAWPEDLAEVFAMPLVPGVLRAANLELGEELDIVSKLI